MTYIKTLLFLNADGEVSEKMHEKLCVKKELLKLATFYAPNSKEVQDQDKKCIFSRN